MTTTRGPIIHGKTTTYAKHDCRCNPCRQAWREAARRRTNPKPSLLANEVDRLNAELDAAELNLEALRQENAMLRCRLQELGE